MIGEVVTSRPGGTVAAVVFFALAATFFGVALANQSAHAAVFAILPLALGFAALLSGDPRVEFEVTADGLSLTAPDVAFVRYDDIRGLTAPVSGSGTDFAIQVYHTDGVLRIPAGLSVPSRELYEFLLDHLPPVEAANPDNVPAKLRDFLAEQLRLFGSEKVFVFRARAFPPVFSYRRHVGYSLGVLLGALGWIVVGFTLDASGVKGAAGWGGGGIVLFLLALLFTFLFWRASDRGRAGNWHESCLIVSPAGIALLQGQLRGKMRWDEVRAIEYPAKPRFGLTSAGSPRSGIGLLVEGAYLIIADYYDRPLSKILSSLHTYWDEQDAN